MARQKSPMPQRRPAASRGPPGIRVSPGHGACYKPRSAFPSADATLASPVPRPASRGKTGIEELDARVGGSPLPQTLLLNPPVWLAPRETFFGKILHSSFRIRVHLGDPRVTPNLPRAFHWTRCGCSAASLRSRLASNTFMAASTWSCDTWTYFWMVRRLE